MCYATARSELWSAASLARPIVSREKLIIYLPVRAAPSSSGKDFAEGNSMTTSLCSPSASQARQRSTASPFYLRLRFLFAFPSRPVAG